MMSIQRYMKTTTWLLQVIPLYISKLLSKCTSIHCSLHPCLPLLWIISDCLLMMSIRRHTQTTATTYKSFDFTEVFCFLNVHSFVLLCTLVFPYNESSLIVFSWWVFRDTWRPRPPYYKSLHCTSVSCCLNVHPFIFLCTLVFPFYESSLIGDCILMMNIEYTLRCSLLNYKSFHCTNVYCYLNVHPFILLCTLVFPYYESSLIVFSWWVFRDTWRPQPPNYKSFHCT